MKKPSQVLELMLLGLIFFALAVLFQLIFFSSHTGTFALNGGSNESITNFGIGAPVSKITRDGETNLNIDWVKILLNVTSTLILSILVAAGVAWATKFERPAKTYGIVAAVIIVFTFFLSMGFSKLKWGYFLTRPGILPEVQELARVNAVVPFKPVFGKSVEAMIQPYDDFSISERVADVRKDQYEHFPSRILLALDKKNLLPAKHTTTLDGYPGLYTLITNSGALVKSSKGYNSSRSIWGIVIDGTDASGAPWLILAVQGGSVSDDHHPYYEMAFTKKGSSGWSLVRDRHFYYDVAGIEGFEWYVCWLIVSFVLIVIVFALMTVLMSLWNLWLWWRGDSSWSPLTS